MLDKFRVAKQEEIARLKNREPAQPYLASRIDFLKKLRAQPFSVIAEYKRASPSLGVINDKIDVEKAAKGYLNGGAAAISILTEEKYFAGQLDYIEKAHSATNGKIPFLRKDFIFDTIQIQATAATPASAILLIARITQSARQLRDFIEYANKFGLSPVVEIFEKDDLLKARKAGAEIIQVNARDLSTLKVDRAAALRFIKEFPPLGNEIWIFASGINCANHLHEARNAGYSAVLVGSSLMSQANPADALKKLLAVEL